MICDLSCWACEFADNGSSWATSAQASNACLNSEANCEFDEKQQAPNGFGYCDFSSGVQQTGGCDSSCSACNEVADNGKEPR